MNLLIGYCSAKVCRIRVPKKSGCAMRRNDDEKIYGSPVNKIIKRYFVSFPAYQDNQYYNATPCFRA